MRDPTRRTAHRPTRPGQRLEQPDRRLAIRFEIPDAEVVSPVLSGRILNLSRRGLAIETGSALRVGARCRFTVTGGERTAEFHGRILWCRLRTIRPAGGDFEPVYRAGIELECELGPDFEASLGTALEVAAGEGSGPDRLPAEPSPEPGRGR